MIKLVNSKAFQIVMFIATIYTLFGDDFRVIVTPKSFDTAFDVLTCIAFIIFAVEIIMNLFINDDYFNSFFFWLDILATISLIFDL